MAITWRETLEIPRTAVLLKPNVGLTCGVIWRRPCHSKGRVRSARQVQPVVMRSFPSSALRSNNEVHITIQDVQQTQDLIYRLSVVGLVQNAVELSG